MRGLFCSAVSSVYSFRPTHDGVGPDLGRVTGASGTLIFAAERR
jgi:hypothetical protein